MVFGILGKKVRPWILHLFVAAYLGAFSAHSIKAQQVSQQTKAYFIERIEIIGTRRVPTASIWRIIHSRTGADYSDEAVQRDAQALRDTGYFDEVRLIVEESPDRANGKIVTFDVKERPVIRRIEYRGIRSISEADIENAYKKAKITLSVESWFDPEKMTHTATVIKELLAAHGHPSAVAKPTYERIASSNIVAILFTID